MGLVLQAGVGALTLFFGTVFLVYLLYGHFSKYHIPLGLLVSFPIALLIYRHFKNSLRELGCDPNLIFADQVSLQFDAPTTKSGWESSKLISTYFVKKDGKIISRKNPKIEATIATEGNLTILHLKVTGGAWVYVYLRDLIVLSNEISNSILIAQEDFK